MRRSTRKKEMKAKRQAMQHDPEVKRGFRKCHIDGAVYQWRYYGDRVEIRPPGKLGLKWLVPIWQLQGEESHEAWLDAHKECYGENCSAYKCTPGMIKKYIEEIRTATCAK